MHCLCRDPAVVERAEAGVQKWGKFTGERRLRATPASCHSVICSSERCGRAFKSHISCELGCGIGCQRRCKLDHCAIRRLTCGAVPPLHKAN